MGKFRYGVDVSAFFDDELDDSNIVPAAIFGSDEAKKRLESYARIREGLRALFSRTPDVPEEVERSLMMRIRRRRYRLLQPGDSPVSFRILTFGRRVRRRAGRL